jgi:RNA polymerase sigma-70 factor (ECF subfamily)
MGAAELALGAGSELMAAESLELGLVARCCAGDAGAFASLVTRHESMVFNLAARLLGNREEARDVSQEVFLQVYRQLRRFQGRSSLKTWIYRIVVNQCRNRQRFWRRRRMDRSCPLEDLSPRDQLRLVSGSESEEDPFERVRRREQEERLRKALLGVSYEHRAVLLLRELEGLSCEEIAGALSVPTGTVKSRLARAREALRQRLVESSQGRDVS